MIGLEEIAAAIDASGAEIAAGASGDPFEAMLRRQGVDPGALAHFALRHARGIADAQEAPLVAMFVSAFAVGLRIGLAQPKGVYAVLRTADVGETEVLMLHSREEDADALAAWVNEHEAPGYTAAVSFEPIDDDAIVAEFKGRG